MNKSAIDKGFADQKMWPAVETLSLSTPVLGFLILSVIGLYVRSYLSSSKYKLPPVVPGIPIFGNSFQVPATQQGPWAKELANKYGEM